MGFDPAASGRVAKAAPAAVKPAVQVAAENEATLRQRADAALAANDAFLAAAKPGTAAAVADAAYSQTVKVTKECSALIRLVLRKLDSAAGT